jgi:hypothetical protein
MRYASSNGWNFGVYYPSIGTIIAAHEPTSRCTAQEQQIFMPVPSFLAAEKASMLFFSWEFLLRRGGARGKGAWRPRHNSVAVISSTRAPPSRAVVGAVRVSATAGGEARWCGGGSGIIISDSHPTM